MPHPNLPPTPAASLDISGKTSAGRAPTLNIGPAAVHDATSDRSISATPSVYGSDSSYNPASPVSPNASKRKQSTLQAARSTGDDFSLPPPPPRARKIIQMKPKQEPSTGQMAQLAAMEAPAPAKGARKRAPNSGTTAAGRKIARKTAHSLIERRRRSKMNEEFGVLKDMIPACRGQEMHKLAILQASIDYLRYLESCITDLQAGGKAKPPPYASVRRQDDTLMDEDLPDAPEDDEIPQQTATHPPSVTTTRPPTSQSQTCFSGSGSASSDGASHSPQNLPPLSHVATASSSVSNKSATSPPFPPVDAMGPIRSRQFSIGSSTAGLSPYILAQHSNGGSNAPSPVFSPQTKAQLSKLATGEMQRFSLTSPALHPVDRRVPAQQQQDKSERSDREAMAALLMLNQTPHSSSIGANPSRHNSTVSVAGWRDGGAVSNATAERTQHSAHAIQPPPRRSGGAMSVRDLLSH